MWRRSGCPSNAKPYISQASRSCHSAPKKMSWMEATRGDSSSRSALTVTPSLRRIEWKRAKTWKRVSQPATPVFQPESGSPAAAPPRLPARIRLARRRLEGGNCPRLARLGLGLVLGFGLCSLLGVGCLVGVSLGLDRECLGVLGVRRRGHPVDARQEVEIVEPGGLAGLRSPSPFPG